MLMLLVFFTTGRWPLHKRLQRSQRVGKHSTSLMALSVTYSRTFAQAGIQLLQKCKFFHFPDIDSSTVVSDFLFEMVFVNRYVLYSNWQLIVPTLLELEGIFEGQIGLAQRCAKSIFFRCYFRAPLRHSLYFVQTTVRALQIPFTTSTRFLASLGNSRVNFANFGE